MNTQEDPCPTEWLTPPAQPILHRNEAHVWRVQLEAGESALLRLHATLSPDERARARRHHRPLDGNHFIVARAALRTILAMYLDSAPDQLRFEYEPQGKPVLKQEAAASPAIAFNLAHSHGLALVAVTLGQRVGIDIERVHPRLAEERIAERFFSANETAALRGLPIAAQPLAFFRGWTRKEAFVKARGDGLAFPLNGFEVSLGPSEPPALLRVTDAPAEAERWSLYELIPAPGYIAALAVEGRGLSLKTWDWRQIDLKIERRLRRCT